MSFIELTPIVDIMARAEVVRRAKTYGVPNPEAAWDDATLLWKQQVKQEILDLLMPALSELDRQVQSAVELELMRREKT